MAQHKHTFGESAAVRVSQHLQVISHWLEDALATVAGKRVGFSLQVWTDGRMNYISNCDRAEMIQQLEGLLEQWKSGAPDVPAHKVQ